MKILLDSTGLCVGLATADVWVGNPSAYTAPAWVDAVTFNRWKWNKSGDITLQINWTLLPTPARSVIDIVDADRQYCDYFLKYLFTQLRADVTLNDTQRISLLSTVTIGMNALAWGDAQAARVAFSSIAITALWTQARKDWVLAQIDFYLTPAI